MDKVVQVRDKRFRVSITADELNEAVTKVAQRINEDYAGKKPMFIVVLNGAFMFASDLLKKIELPCTMSCVKLSSYEGMCTTGKVREMIGISGDLEGKDVIIIEDIVDTGTTMHGLLPKLRAKGVASVEICSLLHKPEALLFDDAKPKYIALNIPNDFIIGYGLDYDGEARNLPEIYTLMKE